MLVPFNTHVLILHAKPAEKSASGLYLPTKDVAPRIPTGTVVAVAADVEGLAVGDTVLYRKWSEVSIEGKDYHIAAFEDVLGKLL